MDTLRVRLLEGPRIPPGRRTQRARRERGFLEEGVQKGGQAGRRRWGARAMDEKKVQRRPKSHILKEPKS